jgi:tetratricopeptide (TPR) repeat protein
MIARMDADTATALLEAAVQARQAMRRGEDASAVAAFEREYADMREAMTWFLDHGQLDQADRFGTALVPFWMTTKRIDDGEDWFRRALGHDPLTDARRARAVYDHGYLVFWAGRYELAEQRFVAARRLAEAAGDQNVVALSLAGSARVALNEDPGTAVALLREAMLQTADLPDSEGRSSADHVLGVALQMSGDLSGARDLMRERLDHARRTGNDFGVFVESSNLSMVERQLGNLDQAEALSLQALRIVAAKRDEMAIPWVLNGLAAVTTAQGRLEHGATLIGIAEALLAKAGGEWPPDERAQFEETMATLASHLSPGAFAQARGAGGQMSLEAALEFASAGRRQHLDPAD